VRGRKQHDTVRLEGLAVNDGAHRHIGDCLEQGTEQTIEPAPSVRHDDEGDAGVRPNGAKDVSVSRQCASGTSEADHPDASPRRGR
jgi:hypothetical protein